MLKVALLNDTTPNNHHGCACVVSAIEAKVAAHGGMIFARSYVNQNWREDPEFMARLPSCDLVIVNGEGTIHHGAPHARSLLEVAPHARALGIPVFLINATWQDNPPYFHELAASFDAIHVRDSLSQAQLRQAGLEARLVPDLTFAEEVLPPQHSPVRAGYGITDSVYNSTSMTLFQIARQHGHAFLPVGYAEEGVLGTVKFHLGGFGKKNITRSPLAYVRYIRYKNAIQDLATRDRSEYVRRIAALEGIVAARYHSLCFAIKVATPFVALHSNSHKTPGMLQDIGLDTAALILAKPGDISPATLDRARASFNADALQKMRAYSSMARLQIESMFASIFSTASR